MGRQECLKIVDRKPVEERTEEVKLVIFANTNAVSALCYVLGEIDISVEHREEVIAKLKSANQLRPYLHVEKVISKLSHT